MKGAATSTESSFGLLELLRCPNCEQGVMETEGPDALRCLNCSHEYPLIDGVPFLFESGSLQGFVEADRRAQKLTTSRGQYSKGGEYHWAEYGIAKLLPPANAFPRVLLVGCGDGGERPYLHDIGYETIGFDIRRSPGTDFVADAHRLPLQDGTVDIVISMQVLEHLHSPWIAVKEIGRVLRPGGWFIGSVAFLKAFHDSYFHMTHMGVNRLLEEAGLEVDHFAGAQSLTYTLYGALIPLGTRRMRRAALGSVDRLLAAARSAIWSASRRLSPNLPTDRFHTGIPMSFREFDKLRFAPAVVFRARKRMIGP